MDSNLWVSFNEEAGEGSCLVDENPRFSATSYPHSVTFDQLHRGRGRH